MEVQWRGIRGLRKQVLDAVREQGVERAVPCRADLGVGLFRRCVQTLVAVDGSVFRVEVPRVEGDLVDPVEPAGDLVGQRAGNCRDLPFRAVARIRGGMRIPGAAGLYRRIRANMERTSTRTGLDHHGRGHGSMAGKGIAARHPVRAGRFWNPAESADTVCDPCWQCPDLTRDRSLGLSRT